MKMEQSIPKRRYIKLSLRGINQKKTHYKLNILCLMATIKIIYLVMFSVVLCGFGTRSFTSKERHKLKVAGNRVHRQ